MIYKKDESGLFAPSYYESFKCIADKCKKSCCIGWDIYIDEKALEKYKKLKCIMTNVERDADGYYFKLDDEGRCPNLDENGLCKIILSYGEEHLTEICQNHPRFYNQVTDKITEVDLGISCEEACRIVLTGDEPFHLEKIGDAPLFDGEDYESDSDQGAFDGFDVLRERTKVFSIIQNQKNDFNGCAKALETAFNLSPLYSYKQWIDRLLSLEILENEWQETLLALKSKELKTDFSSSADYEKRFLRLLEYFAYRHLSVADSETDFRARLSFSLLCVKIIRLIFENGKEHSLEELISISRAFSAEIEYSEDNTFELIFEFNRHL